MVVADGGVVVADGAVEAAVSGEDSVVVAEARSAAVAPAVAGSVRFKLVKVVRWKPNSQI